MDILTTLLAAFAGAGLVALFSYFRTKNEKIWNEKYEVLSGIVSNLNLINHTYTVRHLHGMGVTVASESEIHGLYDKSAQARIQLSENIARLQLLFRKHDIENILENRVELNSAFLDLYNLTPEQYSAEYMEIIASKADSMLEKVIALAQTKIV